MRVWYEKKFSTGEVYESKHGTKVEIVEPYIGGKKCLVKVVGLEYYLELHRCTLKGSKFRTPFCRTVYGVGYLGDGKYRTRHGDGTLVESYKYWANMLKRSYTKYPSDKDVCYYRCSVNDAWHNYQNFAIWFWDNYKLFEGTDIKPYLDKDLLNYTNAKEYSDRNCCLLPNIINTAITLGRSTGSIYGSGVRKNPCGTYTAFITKKAKAHRLGTFSSKEEAYIYFLREKEKYIRSLAEEYSDVLRDDVYDLLRNWKYEEA